MDYSEENFELQRLVRKKEEGEGVFFNIKFELIKNSEFHSLYEAPTEKVRNLV